MSNRPTGRLDREDMKITLLERIARSLEIIANVEYTNYMQYQSSLQQASTEEE